MEQHTKSVVLKAGEAATGPLDLLHAEVEPLGRAVRGTRSVVVQDLLAPALERVAKGADLIDRVGATSGDGLVEENGGVDDVVGEVDVTDGLLGQPRPEQLVVGVTDANDQIRLIQDVELSYPIILGSDGRVMDEMHRIARAILEGHTRIRAVQFVDEPEPDFRDSSPKDMPH